MIKKTINHDTETIIATSNEDIIKNDKIINNIESVAAIFIIIFCFLLSLEKGVAIKINAVINERIP